MLTREIGRYKGQTAAVEAITAMANDGQTAAGSGITIEICAGPRQKASKVIQIEYGIYSDVVAILRMLANEAQAGHAHRTRQLASDVQELQNLITQQQDTQNDG